MLDNELYSAQKRDHPQLKAIDAMQLWDYNHGGDFPYARETEAFQHLEQHVEHYKPPECLPLLEGTMVCQIRVNKGQMVRDHTLPLLKRMAKPSDIAVINFA